MDYSSSNNLDHVEKHQQLQRREFAAFYTPSNAAKLLSDWAIRRSTDRVLEPSFGGCVFLSAAMSRLKALGSPHAEDQLSGFDIDPNAFGHLKSILGNAHLPSHSFKHLDFLSAPVDCQDPVDAVIGNPPFISYHSMTKAQRAAVRTLRESLDVSIPLTAGMWAYFLAKSTKFLKPTGRMAWVLPASFLSADYSQSLRLWLQSTFSRVIVVNVAERLFLDAGTAERVVLVFADGFQGKTSPDNFRIVFAPTLHGLAQRVDQLFDSLELGNAGCDVTIRDEFADIVSPLGYAGAIVELGTICKISIGDVIGDMSFFVKTTAEWATLGIKPGELVPLLRKSQYVSGIKADVDLIGNMQRKNRPYLALALRTKALSKGAKRYIASYDKTLAEVNSTFAKRNPWYSVNYDISARAFLPSISSESPRLILNHAQMACANSLYKIHTKLPNGWWDDIVALSAITSLAQLSAELVGRPLGGGALKLEPSDARKLLLPIPAGPASKRMSGALAKAHYFMNKGQNTEAMLVADEVLLRPTRHLSADSVKRIRALLELAKQTRRFNRPRVALH